VCDEAARRSLQGGDFILLGPFSIPCKNLFTSTISMHLGPRGNQIVARAIAKSLDDHPEK
jgi:hypothetical protein